VTYDPYFKVTTFFDIEYLRNDTRREVVSALYATAFWLAGCPSQPGIVSKWLNLSYKKLS